MIRACLHCEKRVEGGRQWAGVPSEGLQWLHFETKSLFCNPDVSQDGGTASPVVNGVMWIGDERAYGLWVPPELGEFERICPLVVFDEESR